MNQPMQITIDQALKMAENAVSDGNTALAEKLYQAVLKHQPGHSLYLKIISGTRNGSVTMVRQKEKN